MADEVDALYDLPPEDFTAARDELVKSLRSSGEPEEATEVKALRRPTVAAWALNQLARRHGDGVRDLVEAGEALRSAQRKAASGTKDSGFREATERRRALVQSLTRAATDILSERGGGAGAEDEVARTLETASIDPAAAEQLAAGRLDRPILSGGGFEAVTGFEVVPSGEEDEGETSRAERHAHEVAVRNAERQADEAEAEARRAAMRAEHLEDQARQASERAREARAEVERMEREAAEARSRLEDLRD